MTFAKLEVEYKVQMITNVAACRRVRHADVHDIWCSNRGVLAGVGARAETRLSFAASSFQFVSQAEDVPRLATRVAVWEDDTAGDVQGALVRERDTGPSIPTASSRDVRGGASLNVTLRLTVRSGR